MTTNRSNFSGGLCSYSGLDPVFLSGRVLYDVVNWYRDTDMCCPCLLYQVPCQGLRPDRLV